MNSYPRSNRCSLLVSAIVTLAGLTWAVGSASAAWRPVAADSTAGHRVRLVVVSPQEQERPLRGIWTVLEPGQEMQFNLGGSGRVRLESRPLYADPTEQDSYRLRIAVDDSVRRLRRHSAWQYNVRLQSLGSTQPNESQALVGIGEADRVELQWNQTEGRFVVGNRSRQGRVILCRVLLDADVHRLRRKSSAATKDDRARTWGLKAGVPRLGWDSNAYLTAKTDTVPEAKWFLPVELDMNVERDLSGRTAVQAKYTFDGSFYDEPILDERRHRLRLGGTTRLGSQKPRQGTDLFYAYRFTHKNDTYNGRGDREEFETIDPISGQSIPLGNRFDYNEHRLEGGLRKYFSRNVVGTADVSVRNKDYVEDFATYPDIYALDQSQVDLEFGVDWRLRRYTHLAVILTTYKRSYDEKFARDAAGNEIVDTPSTLRHRSLAFTADYGRSTGLRANGELKFFNSTDQYEGYWDYSGTAIEVGGGWRWPTGHRVGASLRYSRKSYDAAHVDHDPAQDLRQKNYLNFKLSGDYIVSSRWTGLIRYRYKDADNNNEPFAYTRAEIVFGLTYRR